MDLLHENGGTAPNSPYWWRYGRLGENYLTLVTQKNGSILFLSVAFPLKLHHVEPTPHINMGRMAPCQQPTQPC
jgi:hypothetical protein